MPQILSEITIIKVTAFKKFKELSGDFELFHVRDLIGFLSILKILRKCIRVSSDFMGFPKITRDFRGFKIISMGSKRYIRDFMGFRIISRNLNEFTGFQGFQGIFKCNCTNSSNFKGVQRISQISRNISEFHVLNPY